MMGEGDALGLKVKITPVIDRSKLNSEGKKVESQLNKNVKLSGTGKLLQNFQGFMPKTMRSMVGSLQSARAGAGGAGGMKGAAAAGAIGGLVAAAMNGIMGVLKKMLSVLLEASPMLKGVVKLLTMGFMMILRPIGDVIAMMLRPIAMFFRIIGREVMKRMRAKRQELKGQGYSGIALAGALMAEMPGIYLDVIFEQLSKIDWSDFFGKILNVLWENLTQRLPAFFGKLFDILSKVAGWLWTEITKPFANMGGILGGFAGWLWKGITLGIGTLGAILGGFGGWLYTAITLGIKTGLDTLAGFGDWLVSTIKGMLGLDNSNGMLAQGKAATVASGGNGLMWDIAGAGKDMMNLMTGGLFGKLTGLASGGVMTADGPIYAHAGEVVKDSGQIQDMIRAAASGGGNVTVVIPGAAMASAIDSRVDYYYRTKVVSRR